MLLQFNRINLELYLPTYLEQLCRNVAILTQYDTKQKQLHIKSKLFWNEVKVTRLATNGRNLE